MYPKQRLRLLPIYIASGREKNLHKYAVIRYPWLSTNYTTCATDIPPHVMLMEEIEVMKAYFDKQTTHIVENTRTELNAQNVGGDLYKAGCVLDEIKAANESFLIKLQYLLATNTGKDGKAEEKTKDDFVLNYQYFEKEEVKELEGYTSGSTPPCGPYHSQ